MLYIAIVLGMVASFIFGYHYKNFTRRVEIVEEAVKKKIDKPVEIESPSMLIDVTDPIQEAIYQAKVEQEKLNAIK